MALDLRLQQKMSQSLVMTPQLQQAIKLLQLSHLEMADALQKELDENPILEERTEGQDDGPQEMALGAEQENQGPDGETLSDGHDSDAGEDSAGAADGGDTEVVSDLSRMLDAPVDQTPEPSSKEVEKEIDWEAYLENYSYSLPSTAGGLSQEDLPPFEASLTKSQSLQEHLIWQVQLADFAEEDRRVALMLIDSINDDGYLAPEAVAAVAEGLETSVEHIEGVLSDLQGFEPVGVAARSVRECLLIQAQRAFPEDALTVAIIDRHLANVEKRNMALIAKELDVSPEDVKRSVRLISQLEPRPGRAFSDKEPQYISPDIYVTKVGDDFVIVLNEDGLPKLKISNYYRQALKEAASPTKSYIQEKLRSAVWLIRSIHMRQRTIYKVMESILKFQRDFFEKGVAHLRPLILKDVADDVEMHESTISRVTSNKYVHTPQGIYELKYFFNSSISMGDGDSIASESVRDHIKRFVGEEDPRSPYSDQKLVQLLGVQQIHIARRTIAKYREMLRIPSSSRRKEMF